MIRAAPDLQAAIVAGHEHRYLGADEPGEPDAQERRNAQEQEHNPVRPFPA